MKYAQSISRIHICNTWPAVSGLSDKLLCQSEEYVDVVQVDSKPQPFQSLNPTCPFINKSLRTGVKHLPVISAARPGDSKCLQTETCWCQAWEPCPVETHSRKLPVTGLKWYPVIRADFRKLGGGGHSVCSQGEAEFISWYTCSSERKTLLSNQIMHAWLIELHTLPWTHVNEKKGLQCSFKAGLIFVYQKKPKYISHFSKICYFTCCLKRKNNLVWCLFFQESTTDWASLLELV